MTDTAMLFLQLAWTFFIIGTFTIGGGYAMLSLIQAQVVTNHHWLTESSFTDIVAISQMTPGPIGVNCATFVGYDVVAAAGGSHLLGILGAATATLSLALPSFVIMLLIVKFYVRFKGSRVFEGMMGTLRPAAIGLIGAAAIILIVRTSWSGTPMFSRPSMELVRDNFPDWKSWLLLAAAFAASWIRKINPILIILAGAVAGLILY